MSEVAEQKSAGYSVESAIQRITTCKGLTHRPLRLTIRKTNPGGLTAHQTTEVDTIYSGIDWEAGQLVIQPAMPLTELSPEDVAAIHKSAKEGQSWHAYRAYEKQKAREKELMDALRNMVDWLDDGNRQLSDSCAADVAKARAAISPKSA